MNNSSDQALTKADFEKLSEFRYRLRCFLHVSETILREEGITPLQYLMLLHIKGMPGREWATVGELAERLQALQHGVVMLVSRCEAAGFVERRPREADRRQVEVHLLKRGERCLEVLATRHRAQLDWFDNEWPLRLGNHLAGV